MDPLESTPSVNGLKYNLSQIIQCIHKRATSVAGEELKLLTRKANS